MTSYSARRKVQGLQQTAHCPLERPPVLGWSPALALLCGGLPWNALPRPCGRQPTTNSFPSALSGPSPGAFYRASPSSKEGPPGEVEQRTVPLLDAYPPCPWWRPHPTTCAGKRQTVDQVQRKAELRHRGAFHAPKPWTQAHRPAPTPSVRHLSL